MTVRAASSFSTITSEWVSLPSNGILASADYELQCFACRGAMVPTLGPTAASPWASLLSPQVDRSRVIVVILCHTARRRVGWMFARSRI